MNPLLYGRNDERNIVGLYLSKPDEMTVCYRRGDRIEKRPFPFTPFGILSDEGLEYLDEELARAYTLPLKGNGHYRHLIQFGDFFEFLDARKVMKRAKEEDDILYGMYAPPSAETQFLMQTGRTLFKGMTEQDVRRMQLDIETYSPNGYPNPENPEHSIIIISMTDNTGYEKVLALDNPLVEMGLYPELDYVEFVESEAALLRAMVREIARRDPDIIEGHNILGFDLPYIEQRCLMNGVVFGIGRDHKPPRTWQSSKKLAERDLAFTNYAIAGRHVIDTMFLAGAYDVFTRALPDLTLKGVAHYFREQEGVTYAQMHGRDRQYVKGDDIARTWDENPMKLIEYALDDVRETRYLSDKLAAATFYLTQMVPMGYQAVHLGGPATVIENLMVRAYFDQRHSLPRPTKGMQAYGGLTLLRYTGRFNNLVYADVNSLYPSIMIHFNVEPRSDVLGVFRKQLIDLTNLRLAVKEQYATEKDQARKSMLKGQEQSYKVVTNTFYGAMGFQYFIFNDFERADAVAINGQAILRKMMEEIEARGGTVIEADTDGVLFVAPEAIREDQEAQKALVAELNTLMPPGIVIGMDGLYETMISYKKKNYALRGYDGKLKVKGGAFKARGTEPFVRAYIGEQLLHLLDGNVEAMRDTHDSYKRRIFNRELALEDFAVRATLKDAIDTYDEKVEEGNNQAAQYEIAKQMSERTGRDPERGDVVHYYIAGDRAASTVRNYRDAKPIADYTPGSENIRHYLSRLQEAAKRFKVFFTKEDFGTVFAPPPKSRKGKEYTLDLFPDEKPDLTGVTIQNTEVENEQV